ncbi:MAG: Lrp/AsnC family transcriptional regulator [Nitrospinae bacterium]|nr:Lrp/AsnC family transcriptional regulator [Nitrospinota bacterium]
MKKEITAYDVRIMAELQRSLPMTKNPFKSIADKLGIAEEDVIAKTREYAGKKYYRRFGATLRHQKAGFTANGMGVWSVPDAADRQRLGELLSNRPEVSHAYERPSFEDWPFHLFTMIHGESEDEVKQIAKRMAEETGIKDYDVLFSTREFKKTSMMYFDHWPLPEEGKN